LTVHGLNLCSISRHAVLDGSACQPLAQSRSQEETVDTLHVAQRQTGSVTTVSRRRTLRAVGGGSLAALLAVGQRQRARANQDAATAATATLPPAIAEWVSATQTLDVARAAATFAPDAVREVVPIKQIDRGHEAIQARLQAVHDAFAGGTAKVLTAFAAADQAVAEWVIEAHYTGQLAGYPPGSGQPITLRGVSLFELLDEGAIARETLHLDVYGLLVQLGVAPVPGEA
jgi:steroid delta-isomerase-like uncharacterized protein